MPAHSFTLRHWFCLFAIPVGTNPDGSKQWEKHIIRATGIDDQQTVHQHLSQMHPEMKILDLHPLQGQEEINEAIVKLREDPNWLPLNNAQLAESAKQSILGEPLPEAQPPGLPGQAASTAAHIQTAGVSAPVPIQPANQPA